MEPVYQRRFRVTDIPAKMFGVSLQAGSKTITNLFLVPPWSSGTD